MNPTGKPPSGMSPEMQADYDRWAIGKSRVLVEEKTFVGVREELVSTLANLPDQVDIPYHLTAEGERWGKFKKVCDAKFLAKVDYALIPNRQAFDLVANWDGGAPGPCAVGATDQGKTRAAWWALRRLYVKENLPFAWFPVRRLVNELERYEKQDCAEEFFRAYDFHKILFVDDVDKINWDFESHSQMLFSFFDWVYRHQKPCIATTNRDRKWWSNKMGDAFTRRLFQDACQEVIF